MPRRLTTLAPGSICHDLFFLRRMKEYLTPTAKVLAFCLMRNHYHLLLRIVGTDFSTRMKFLGISYAKWRNTRHERVGHVFGGRFNAKIVETDEYLLNDSRYIHLKDSRFLFRTGGVREVCGVFCTGEDARDGERLVGCEGLDPQRGQIPGIRFCGGSRESWGAGSGGRVSAETSESSIFLLSNPGAISSAASPDCRTSSCNPRNYRAYRPAFLSCPLEAGGVSC